MRLDFLPMRIFTAPFKVGQCQRQAHIETFGGEYDYFVTL